MDQKIHATSDSRQRNCRECDEVHQTHSTMADNNYQIEQHLMQAVVERENMQLAFKRVTANNGASGIDGMTVDDLKPWLIENWHRVKEDMLNGRYKPQPVRRVEIPKPGGKGMRQLGIPTVVDRMIQQALHQVLSPLFDPLFSEHSYGFRPGRSAQMAVLAARQFVADGRRWVVDMDLEKFFDRVNHDILMTRVARKVKDKEVLRLIRRYLQAGMMDDGVVSSRYEGTPQGGPLSPLLSNILLDELDKELEHRGHCFCRYADDCNIYVKTERSGQRVFESISAFLEKRLKLKVNREKSAVDRPWKRKFLGYSMTSNREPRLKVAKESIQRLKSNLIECFHRGRGRNLKRFINEELNPKLRGWFNYFALAEVKNVFEELDGWIRRHLRNILWRQWKRPRFRVKRLMNRGLSLDRARQSAYNERGPWYNSGASHMNLAFPMEFFNSMGLYSLLEKMLIRRATQEAPCTEPYARCCGRR